MDSITDVPMFEQSEGRSSDTDSDNWNPDVQKIADQLVTTVATNFLLPDAQDHSSRYLYSERPETLSDLPRDLEHNNNLLAWGYDFSERLYNDWNAKRGTISGARNWLTAQLSRLPNVTIKFIREPTGHYRESHSALSVTLDYPHDPRYGITRALQVPAVTLSNPENRVEWVKYERLFAVEQAIPRLIKKAECALPSLIDGIREQADLDYDLTSERISAEDFVSKPPTSFNAEEFRNDSKARWTVSKAVCDRYDLRRMSHELGPGWKQQKMPEKSAELRPHEETRAWRELMAYMHSDESGPLSSNEAFLHALTELVDEQISRRHAKGQSGPGWLPSFLEPTYSVKPSLDGSFRINMTLNPDVPSIVDYDTESSNDIEASNGTEASNDNQSSEHYSSSDASIAPSEETADPIVLDLAKYLPLSTYEKHSQVAAASSLQSEYQE